MNSDWAKKCQSFFAWVMLTWLLHPGELVVRADVPNYAIHNWQVEDGLPTSTVTEILQSRDGYLWLGTLAGLVRFDGVHFAVFDHNRYPDLKNGRITALHQDSRGSLWIGHETGHLTRLENGNFSPIQLPASWSEDVVSSIAEDQHGKIWVQSRQGRLACVGDDLVMPATTDDISSYGLATMAIDVQGRLWSSRGGELSYLSDGKLVVPDQAPVAVTNFVQTFCAAADGGLWVVRGGRLRKYKDGLWQPISPVPDELGNANGIAEIRGSLLAIRTTDQGLWLVNPNHSVRHFSRTNGLTSNWLQSVCEDREGDLWLGTANGGLNRLRAVNFDAIKPPDQWNHAPVLAVNVANDGGIWACSEGSGLYHLLAGHWAHYGRPEGLTSDYVWSVLEDAEGQVWVATWGGGLCVGKHGRFGLAPGLEQVRVPMTSLLQGADGSLWVGTRAGLLHYKSGQAAWFGLQQGLKSADVRAIAETPDGAVWFGMMGGGLGHLQNDVVRQYGKADGLASDFVLSLQLDSTGALWIGTDGEGLIRLKNGTFANIGAREGLPNSIISNLEVDELGFCWLSSAGGIIRIPMRDLNRCADGQLKKLNCLSYGVWDGLETSECSGGFQPSGCKTSDGRLWIPTRKGLVTVNPAQLNTNVAPSPVVIEGVLADGLPVRSPGTVRVDDRLKPLPANLTPVSLSQATTALQVPPGSQRLEFLFTALSFAAPDHVRFKYRLGALDDDWLSGDSKRNATYNHVPPGRYHFQVTACNEAGIWTEPGAEVDINVLPLFWQTWWFHVLTYASGAGLLAGAVFLESRRRHNRRLEKIERQQAVERERARIAQDMHDDLGANLTRISLLSQTAITGMNADSLPAQYLRQIYTSARDLTRAMDEIVWAVNPQHDTLESLLNYLTRFAFDFLRSSSIRCRLDLPVQIPDWKIRSEIRHNVFLAFKEVLHNAVKHSGAAEVRVSLQLRHGGFDLRIEDDGKGFAVSNFREVQSAGGRAAPGNGLANIQSRLQAIRGTAQVTSVAGAGTSVLLSVPVADAQDLC